ncbi:serine hydrolase domain-containing protein [Pseudoalteromonas piscicida]|uniref:serine hydrolase domain-containing protein n=1 Tax=Pseudoalteromonas piscicida TaxID=43662 RepID=UPI0030B46953
MKKRYFLAIFLGWFNLSLQAQELNFDAVLECHNMDNMPGMAVRLEQSGKLIYKGAIGLASLESQRKLHADDVFQIGSVTKTFTAAAILKLSEQGKLSLKDNIGKFIPSINPEYKNLTIENILSHTSGLDDYLSDPEVTAIYHKPASLDQVIEAISRRGLLSKAGEKYRYSNLGYILLGKIIEVSSGNSYQEFLSQTFFIPLGMHNTYVMTEGTELEQVRGYTSNSQSPNNFLIAETSPDREWNVDRSWIASAGAIASTLNDMARWQQALTSGKVISNDNYQRMHSRALLLNGDKVNYGYGVDIYPISGLSSYSHQGRVPGYFSWHVYFPSEDLTATAFANADTKHPGPTLLDMIAKQLNLSPKRVSGKREAEIARNLVGRYKSNDSKLLTIFFENGILYSQFDSEEKRVILPREGNAYSYKCTENYFQLRESHGSKELVPVHLYHGEQTPLTKL